MNMPVRTLYFAECSNKHAFTFLLLASLLPSLATLALTSASAILQNGQTFLKLSHFNIQSRKYLHHLAIVATKGAVMLTEPQEIKVWENQGNGHGQAHT
jgi:hypothetical protein